MSNNGVDDRYRYMGLEMIPTPRYDALTSESSPGTGWMWRFKGGIVALKFANDKVLTCTGQGFSEAKDWDRGDEIQDVILDSAADGLSIPEALERVRKKFGEPDAVIDLPDVNNPAEEFCAKAQELLNT
ncbi:MAG: hypothetical protein SPK00_07745 [Corynebacterium glucuronolyticum]|nr:hypothetical protein [Corynebacterium glucuronolyticum]MDD7587205.1 hypothetical protein [Mycobacteriaceae bacterium]MDY5834624.1 hypothetical protein [Corynebacterium glucuronolyticum]